MKNSPGRASIGARWGGDGAVWLVIARCAKRAVAIQLECFVAAQGAVPRNDKLNRTSRGGIAANFPRGACFLSAGS